MPSSASDTTAATTAYRAAQLKITAALLKDMRRLRRLLVPARLTTAVPQYIEAVRALVDRYGQASGALAADWYEAQREAAGITSRFTVPVAETPPDDQVEESLRWATKDLWPRDPEDPQTTLAQQQPITVRLGAAEVKSEQATQRLVAEPGRETVRAAVRRDREAVAYARSASLGACSFCKLMASRGAVYKTRGAAGADADELFAGDASVVKFHDNCHCGVVPVFRGQRFELSPQAAGWDRIYQDHAAGHPGRQLALFRRALRSHDTHPLPAAH
jgi:hypothetical protein